MKYTTVVGLEVHVQLLTHSKIFCGCANRFNPDKPNSQTCPVCIGLPGALPVMNRQAFELSLKTALALNCTIAEVTKWDRKQYYYPDLPKGYQISQYDLPMSASKAGWKSFPTSRRRIASRRSASASPVPTWKRTRARACTTSPVAARPTAAVDLNRTGTPLLEIVSEPDMRSPAGSPKSYLDGTETAADLSWASPTATWRTGSACGCDANVNLHVAQDSDGTKDRYADRRRSRT